MTKRNINGSALCLVLSTFACACGSGDLAAASGEPAGDDPVVTCPEPAGGESAESESLTASDQPSDVASIRGHVASVEGRRSLVDVNVCVVEPVFGCTTTDELGNFELSYMPKDRPVELVFFRDGYLPAMQQAISAAGVSVLMVPNSSVTEAMGAEFPEGGALVIEMLPLTYEPSAEITPVKLALNGASVHYLDREGTPDPALSAVSARGIALAFGLEPGVLHVEAASLGHEACVFLKGGNYLPRQELVVTEHATTSVTLLCAE